MEAQIEAAKQMDWGQVVGNGGPPCFRVMEGGRFCGRAQRWDGHHHEPHHEFVSLAEMLEALVREVDEANHPLLKSDWAKATACTDCGGDAWLALGDVKGPEGQIVGPDERLCFECAKKRGCPDSLTAPLAARTRRPDPGGG